MSERLFQANWKKLSSLITVILFIIGITGALFAQMQRVNSLETENGLQSQYISNQEEQIKLLSSQLNTINTKLSVIQAQNDNMKETIDEVRSDLKQHIRG